VGINRVFSELDLSQCKEMYKPEHTGILHIRAALDQKFLKSLRKEILSFERAFKTAISTNSYLSIDLTKNGEIPQRQFPMCVLLAADYNHLVYDAISCQIGFREHGRTSVEMNMYPAGYGRIRQHQDDENEVNLIGSVSVSGPGIFSCGKGWHAPSFRVEPGDLVLMRANLWYLNKLPTDFDTRPSHSVKALDEVRYSIVIRDTIT